MKRVIGLVLVSAALGCATDRAGQGTQKPVVVVPGKSRALTLDGPGGSLSIGDTLQDAKRAFPAPEGAEVYETSMAFAILKVDGWTWGEGMGTGFEVALKGGKVIAMAYTALDGPRPKDAIDQQKSAVGEPSRLAESDNAAMVVWEAGENARFFVLFKKEMPLFGVGAITIIGPKEELKLLNYRYDDPDTFVKQIDGTAEQFKDLKSERDKKKAGG